MSRTPTRHRAGDPAVPRPLRPDPALDPPAAPDGRALRLRAHRALDAAQSRLSFHLKVLKDAGLVTDRREGRWMYYTLNTEALAEMAELANGLASAPSAAERGAAAAELIFFEQHINHF